MTRVADSGAVVMAAAPAPEAAFRLDGDVAIVTGAAAGIGRAIARTFAAAGATVVAADIDGAAAQDLADELRDTGGKVLGLAADVAEEASATALLDRAVAEFGRIDILVNNAGIYPPGESLPAFDAALYEKTYAVNVFGLLRLTGEVSRRMESGGRIINLSSMESLRPSSAGTAHYTSSKAAINGITRAAAVDLAPLGIRVNAILPGVVRTQGTAAIPDEAITAFASRALSGRVGEVQDVANAALFLASPASDYVNGHCLVIDGGTTAVG